MKPGRINPADLFRLIRWPNLAMVALTQTAFFYIIRDLLEWIYLPPVILTTILLTASGYIINDIYDQENDRLNLSRRIVGHGIEENSARQLFYFFGVAGLMSALGICFLLSDYNLVIVYLIGFVLLWLYSSSFKRLPLIGNLIVAGFCALVPAILLYIAYLKNGILHETDLRIKVFIWFSFLVTLWREVVKDIEDIAGDMLVGAKTLPIVLGESKARFISILFGIGLSFGLLAFMINSFGNEMEVLSGTSEVQMKNVFFVILYNSMYILCFAFSLLLIFRNIKARKKVDYSILSSLLKYFTLFGIIALTIGS